MNKYNLDAEMQAFVDRSMQEFGDDSASQNADEQRRRYTALCRVFDRPHPDGLTITNDIVSGDAGNIPIRIYRPEGSKPMGCLIFFHGGGWVVGNLDSHDSITAELAHHAGIIVIGVDYRLAPEAAYPAAHEDCWVCGGSSRSKSGHLWH